MRWLNNKLTMLYLNLVNAWISLRNCSVLHDAREFNFRVGYGMAPYFCRIDRLHLEVLVTKVEVGAVRIPEPRRSYYRGVRQWLKEHEAILTL